MSRCHSICTQSCTAAPECVMMPAQRFANMGGQFLLEMTALHIIFADICVFQRHLVLPELCLVSLLMFSACTH